MRSSYGTTSSTVRPMISTVFQLKDTSFIFPVVDSFSVQFYSLNQTYGKVRYVEKNSGRITVLHNSTVQCV